MEDLIQAIFTIGLLYIAFGPVIHLIVAYFIREDQ
jgi:hypothetical protein